MDKNTPMNVAVFGERSNVRQIVRLMVIFVCLYAFFAHGKVYDLSKVAIDVPERMTKDMHLAVDELKYHLKLVAGTEFVNGAPLRFAFGKPRDATPLKPFESRYRVKDGTVWFWGDDGGDSKLWNWGDNRGSEVRRRRGTLFAVELFIERELGVRWLWPGEDGIDYAAKRSINLPEGLERSFVTQLSRSRLRNYPPSKPSAAYRAMNGFTPVPLRDMECVYRKWSHEAREIWLLRHRLQDREYYRYGHAFTDWKRRFGKTHPEYLNWNASRKERGYTGTQGDDRTKHCVSNEAVVDQVISDWLSAGTNRYLNVCENDSNFYCECDGCCALDVRLPGEPAFDHVTDRYCNFWNRIARKARAVRPDVKLVAYAYSRYRKAPRREKVEYPDNMLFGFVPSIMDDASEEFLKWRSRGMAHFFLRPNYHHYIGTIPRGLERFLYDNFHQCLEFGMTGVDYDAGCVRHVMNLEYYVTARMLADPKLPFETICSEFYAGYGPAADDVRRYFEKVRTHGEKARDELVRLLSKKIRVLDDSELSLRQTFGRTEEGLREELSIVEAAAEKWRGRLSARQAKRLDELRLIAQHAVLTYRFIEFQKNPGPEFERRGRELIEFRVANRDAMPDIYVSVFGSWYGELNAWRRCHRYRLVDVDGGTLDPRGIRYGWSHSFEGMGYGRWRSSDRFSCVTNDVASKGSWSCRLSASEKSGIRDDNLMVIPGARYRLGADLLAENGVIGAKVRVAAYAVPEKNIRGRDIVFNDFRDLPPGRWSPVSVEFTAPAEFPTNRTGWLHHTVCPHIRALGGPPGSALHVDNIRVEYIGEPQE